MMWLTRRAILKSNGDMAGAITAVLVGFVSKPAAQGKIKRWYSSLKSNDGIPSFRLYVEIDEDDELSIVTGLDDFLRNNAAQIGWTGEYFSPDPEFNPAHEHLNEIIQACGSVLKLVKSYPSLSRYNDASFWSKVRSEVAECLSAMDPVHWGAYIHFVANNLGMPDDVFLSLGGFTRT
jgi:hypothetical protein